MVSHPRSDARGQSQLFVLSGPNGAGKTTTAATLLPKSLDVKQFVNADNIAAGLSPFAPETTAFEAGKRMLRRMRELLAGRQSFAYETTLAGKRNHSTIREAGHAGYAVHIIYIWLSSPELALARVADRVSLGGHDVPEEVIRRRYSRDLVNFFGVYRGLASSWTLCDNSGAELVIVAQGLTGGEPNVTDPARLRAIERSVENAGQQR